MQRFVHLYAEKSTEHTAVFDSVNYLCIFFMCQTSPVFKIVKNVNIESNNQVWSISHLKCQFELQTSKTIMQQLRPSILYTILRHRNAFQIWFQPEHVCTLCEWGVCVRTVGVSAWEMGVA